MTHPKSVWTYVWRVAVVLSCPVWILPAVIVAGLYPVAAGAWEFICTGTITLSDDP